MHKEATINARLFIRIKFLQTENLEKGKIPDEYFIKLTDEEVLQSIHDLQKFFQLYPKAQAEKIDLVPTIAINKILEVYSKMSGYKEYCMNHLGKELKLFIVDQKVPYEKEKFFRDKEKTVTLWQEVFNEEYLGEIPHYSTYDNTFLPHYVGSF